MGLRDDARGTGLLFIGSVLGMIALLVIGLGIASWFTAGQTALDSWGPGSFNRATMSVGLVSIDVCSAGECVSAPTYELADGEFRTGSLVTLIVGAAFGLAVLWFAHRRIADAEVPVLIKGLGYALGFAAITCACLTMFIYAPGAMLYEVTSHGSGLFPSSWDSDGAIAISNEPDLALGGFLTLAGFFLGGVVVWGVRIPEPVREARRERRLRRESRPEPLRGPDDDPFRSPPAPAPIAVVRHERPTTTPVVANGSDEPPKLLR